MFVDVNFKLFAIYHMRVYIMPGGRGCNPRPGRKGDKQQTKGSGPAGGHRKMRGGHAGTPGGTRGVHAGTRGVLGGMPAGTPTGSLGGHADSGGHAGSDSTAIRVCISGRHVKIRGGHAGMPACTRGVLGGTSASTPA